MDSFIKNIKKKLSVDSLVDLGKDPQKDEDAAKEEAMRKTLKKLDPDSVVDVDEMASKLNEVSEEINAKKKLESTSKKIIDAAKAGIEALQKPNEPEEKACSTSSDNAYLQALGKEENYFKLCDDFN